MNDEHSLRRMAGDYEIIQAIHIGDREIVLGESPRAKAVISICVPSASRMSCLRRTARSCAATTMRRW